MLKKKKFQLSGDKWLVLLPLFLTIFGLLAIFEASSISAIRDFNDKFHYLKNQLTWFGLGVFAFYFFSVIDYRLLKKIAFPLFVFTIALLLAVLVPGVAREVYGGKRWLQFGSFVLQPAELAKFSIILYFSTLFEKKRELLPFALVIGTILGLLILEPDLGTAVIVVATGFCLYFVSGAPMKNVLSVSVAALLLSPLLIIISPYRMQRLVTFLESSFNAQNSSYHVKQILIALGSGGIFGRGFGQSRQKFLFLPEVTTDSIFAVIGEELGLIGAAILIVSLFFLVYRCFQLALTVKDPFARMLVCGVGFCIGIQTVINLGAMVALLPLTGVPLPFVSYGGSSLLICLAGMGIVYNISKSK